MKGLRQGDVPSSRPIHLLTFYTHVTNGWWRLVKEAAGTCSKNLTSIVSAIVAGIRKSLHIMNETIAEDILANSSSAVDHF